jgi:hypothetical protein
MTPEQQQAIAIASARARMAGMTTGSTPGDDRHSRCGSLAGSRGGCAGVQSVDGGNSRGFA